MTTSSVSTTTPRLYDFVTGAKTPTEDEKYLADINCDGSVDVADLTRLSRMMLDQATLEDIYARLA